MHQVIYAESAKVDLKKMDLQIAQRIIGKILFFSQQKNPLAFAKALKNLGIGRYRFRIGDYRAIFKLDSNGHLQILMILRIKHRKDVYLS
ncbi:type II toxin-antitoxin system RelE/ParE family toxin [Candidatus Peregrinibacteria bacterium]|nr:type II toxin-antitoxin system RelE/ParE family toxin [Candidatus Peregrinibacteria bacterium]